MTLRALADVQSGRLRDGERALRGLAMSHEEAQLHLAMLLAATRRGAEAREILEEMRKSNGPLSDDARLQLMTPPFSGDLDRRAELHDEIEDTWIKREAKKLLDPGE
jgi:hypothetical protein